MSRRNILIPIIRAIGVGAKPLKVILFIFLASFILQYFGCAPGPNTELNPGLDSKEDKSGLEQKWGIQICGIRLSAVGYMLDFRYRIIYPEKAAPILSRAAKPYIIDEKSGARLIVPAPPKVGALRQKSSEPQPNRIYFIMFANPGRLVKPGNKVTVIIGDFKAEGLIVK